MEIEETDALGEEIIAFLDSVRSGRPPAVSGLEGRRALALAMEISQRVQEGIQLAGSNLGQRTSIPIDHPQAP